MARTGCYVIASRMSFRALPPRIVSRTSRAAALVAGLGLLPAALQAAPVKVVAAESVYGAVAHAIAGPDAEVISILANPAQDPHLYEAGPAVARAVAGAGLVIENGAGYDPWMTALLAADPAGGRVVIDVAALVHAPAGANPHLWYDPAVMRRAAGAIAGALARLAPAQAAALHAHAARVAARLDVLDARVAALRARFGGQAVAATEPVFAPMAAALGLVVRDAPFQLAVMNGTEPRASAVAAIEADLRRHAVRALLFNAQVTDGATQRLLGIAREAGVPVVGVTETLPAGEDYTGWMLAQLDRLEAALAAPVR